jgi:hypothetical protein
MSMASLTHCRFVFYLVPTHYTLEGLVMTQFENDKTPIQVHHIIMSLILTHVIQVR